MRIVDVGDERYQVLHEIPSFNVEFIDRLKELYKGRNDDRAILKSIENPAHPPHHLICRKIENAEYEEINIDADAI